MATSLVRFFLQIFAILPIHAAGVLLVFRKESRRFLAFWKNRNRQQAAAQVASV